MTAAFRLEGVTVRYGARPALDAIDLDIPRGALVALVGPNGAGKTTLLRVLAGGVTPDAGKVAGAAPGEIAFMPQLTVVSDDAPMTVAGYVAGGLWRRIGLFGGVRAADAARVRAALAEVGLGGDEARLMTTLSGGQRQRAAFARAIVQDAAVLLLDEPFAAIDAAGAERLLGLIAARQAAGATVIAAMHDLAAVRRHFPQTVLVAGRLIASGPTADVLTPQALDAARRALDAAFDDALCAHPHVHDHGPAHAHAHDHAPRAPS